MFWNGSHWIDERAAVRPAPVTSRRSKRDIVATLPILFLVPVLLFPFLSVGAGSLTPTLTISGSSVPGGALTVTGSDFTARDWIDLRWDGTPIGTTVRVDSRSSFRVQMTVPGSTTPGTHQISAYSATKTGNRTGTSNATAGTAPLATIAVDVASTSGSPVPTPAPTPAPTPTPTVAPTPTPQGTAAATISGVGASTITQTDATIRWTVSEVATGQVEYGQTTAYGTLSTPELSYTWSTHVQALSGLTAGSAYHYRVKSGTASGVILVSADYVFTTPASTVAPTPAPTPMPTPTRTPTPTTTPNPTPTPTPTPPTSSTGTNVPSTIDATGATDTTAKLLAFFASVPDGSTILFNAGGTYRVDAALKFSNRHNLVFEGNGATIKAGGTGTNEFASLFALWGGNTGITIRNFTLVGNSPTPGIFQGGREGAHGVLVDGGSNIDISNVTMRGLWGDSLYVGLWADGVRFHDSHVVSAGRNGVTIIAGQNVVVERNAFDKVGYTTFDIEPNTSAEGARNVKFLNNTFGTWSNSFVSGEGAVGSIVNGVTISGNSSTQSTLLTVIGLARRQNVVFTNNKSTATSWGPILRFAYIDGLTVTGNQQSVTSGTVLSIIDSTSVTTN